jgi:hypothetical protein
MLTLEEIADELCRRLLKIFLRGPDGRRPVFGGYEKFQTDPHFKDYILFHEYFHGDQWPRLWRIPPDRLDRTDRQPHQPTGGAPAADIKCAEPVSAEPVHV